MIPQGVSKIAMHQAQSVLRRKSIHYLYMLQPVKESQNCQTLFEELCNVGSYIVEKCMRQSKYFSQDFGTATLQFLHRMSLQLFIHTEPTLDVQATEQD